MSIEQSLEEGRTAEFVRYWLGQRPDLDPEALALQLTIARLTIMSRRTLARMAEAQGITATDFQIMGVIKRGGEAGAPTRPSDLWKLFSLTPAGSAKVDAVMTGYSALIDDKLTAVDAVPGGRKALTGLLRALARAWEAGEEGDVELDA